MFNIIWCFGDWLPTDQISPVQITRYDSVAIDVGGYMPCSNYRFVCGKGNDYAFINVCFVYHRIFHRIYFSIKWNRSGWRKNQQLMDNMDCDNSSNSSSFIDI